MCAKYNPDISYYWPNHSPGISTHMPLTVQAQCTLWELPLSHCNRLLLAWSVQFSQKFQTTLLNSFLRCFLYMPHITYCRAIGNNNNNNNNIHIFTATGCNFRLQRPWSNVNTPVGLPVVCRSRDCDAKRWLTVNAFAFVCNYSKSNSQSVSQSINQSINRSIKDVFGVWIKNS